MKQKTFNQLVMIIFGIGALVHFYRLVSGLDARLGDWMIPVWVSIIGLGIASYLAYAAYKLNNK